MYNGGPTWLVGERVTSGRIPVGRGMVGGTAEPRGRTCPTREGGIGGVRALEANRLKTKFAYGKSTTLSVYELSFHGNT